MGSTEEQFFDTSFQEIPDNLSEGSDSSYHSIEGEMEKISIENSFIKESNEQSYAESSNADTKLEKDSSSEAETTKEKDLINGGNITDEQKLKRTKENYFITGDDEEDIPDDINNDDYDEDDILNIVSVKRKDEKIELKLKDRDVDLSEEDIEKFTSEAIEIKRAGNILYTENSLTEAINEYNKGLEVCPLSSAEDRAMVFHNRAVAYVKLEENKLAVLSLDKAIELNPAYLKAIVRRAGLHEEADELDDALRDYQKVLEIDPSNKVARQAVLKLPPIIEERNEKLKAEMMGKLKDLGNMILKPFGLSTNNFQMQQDPNSGGYNIKFNQ